LVTFIYFIENRENLFYFIENQNMRIG